MGDQEMTVGRIEQERSFAYLYPKGKNPIGFRIRANKEQVVDINPGDRIIYDNYRGNLGIFLRKKPTKPTSENT